MKTKTKQLIKDKLSSILLKTNKLITLVKFNDICDDIYDYITEQDVKKIDLLDIQNLISSYSVINKNRININLDNKNKNMTFEKLQKVYNQSNKDDDDDFIIIETEDKNNNQTKEKTIIKPTINTNQIIKYPPFGTQHVHDEQRDDIIDEEAVKLSEIVDKLCSIDYPEQKSDEWFRQRNERMTASDVGCVVHDNHYEYPYKFIMKKCRNPPFKSNQFCYHGTKFEEIATMIISYRLNVQVLEFGLVLDPDTSFLGASPDGIIGKFKLDGIHLTNLVGTMIEIKVPLRRRILHKGEIKGEICPIYYWDQVQVQLQCCKLKKCLFWQCNIVEYNSRDEFIEDTHETESFRSKTTGFEKGCLIQLLPKSIMNELDKNNEKEYLDKVYDYSKFLYPDKIEMSPDDCDKYISHTMSNFDSILKSKGLSDYCFDKVIYWKLLDSECSEIERDDEWFKEKLPILEKSWKYVSYLRENEEEAQLVYDYVDSLELDKIAWNDRNKDKLMKEGNEKIMNVISKLYKYRDKESKRNKFMIKVHEEMKKE